MNQLTPHAHFSPQPKYGMRETIGNATLYCGDSQDILSEITDVHAVVTDPPYGLSLMGKAWDYEVPQKALWELVFATLRQGGHLLSFSSSRTYHRMAVEVEDAGFDIRDQLMWLYGSGFPKSRDVSKDLDRMAGAVREVVGEQAPIGYTNLQVEHGVQTVNVHQFAKLSNEPVSEDAMKWNGWGTALKPAHEPIVMARKPFKGSVAANLLEHETGAINIEGSRADGGRWPANVIHDGLTEDWSRYFYCAKPSRKERDHGLEAMDKSTRPFFQTANGTSGESSMKGKGQTVPRANTHPTVKPIALMEYLVGLVTPSGGTVLDPYMGSGSTGVAAVQNGFRFIGIERDPTYFEIACERIRADIIKSEASEP